jgi:hypothetical protein
MTPPDIAAQPDLPLALYELRFRAETDLVAGPDPRGLWHGVFGLNLHRLCCVFPGTECRHCLLLHDCQYSYLFSGPRPPDSELMRRYDTIPVPHIFRLDATWPETIHSGQLPSVGMVLVGAANERLPLVIQALAAAGQGGLGAERARLLLQDVVQHLPGQSLPQLVATEGRILDAHPPTPPPTPAMPALVRMLFLSPYKPSGRAANPDGLDAALLLMAVVRRISLLQYFYTGRKLEAPFGALKTASEQARVVDHQLRRQSASRFSARHGSRIDTGGLVGHIDLAMDNIEPLWPYLHLGQWLNLGKNASMGYGAYRLYALPA